jgi:proteasome lid subunit RPN8/RPN11
MLRISKRIMDQIERHVRAELRVPQQARRMPQEACGILAGRDGLVTKLYRVANRDDNPHSGYYMDPREQSDVISDAQEQGLSLLAIYHSHIASEAYPSERDRKLAFYPDLYYMIISVANLKRPVVRMFTIRRGEVQEHKFRIVRNQR